MPIKACQSKILIDQWDFSGATNGFTVNMEAKSLDYAVLQNCAQLRLPGLPMANIEHNGYFTGPNAGDMEYEMNARLASVSTIRLACILGTSAAIPVAFVMNSTFNQQLKYKAHVEGLLEIAGNWPAGNEKLVRGYQVAAAQTVSATGAITGIDFGAAGSAGGKAFLQVQTITGSATNATITVQSDTDPAFGTAALEGTFTFSAVGMYEVDLSGVVNRYVRLNCTSKGGATSFLILGIVAISGVTY